MAKNFSCLKGRKFISLVLGLVFFGFSAKADTTPPIVISTTPGNWSIGINAGTPVSAVFSEAMNPATINSSTFQLRNALTNTLVPATITYNATTRTATLYPTSSLTSLLYYVNIDGGSTGVKDMSGLAMTNDYSWYFIMIPLFDLTAPIVLSVSPANGSTGVSVGTNATAILSEEMLTSSINTTTVELRNPANVLIPATVYYNNSTRTITLDPVASLSPATVYRATVKGGSTGVKDENGNPMQNSYSWTFTTAATGDFTPPTIIAVSPANGSTGVSISTAVSVVFSEPMNPATINTSTIELRNPSSVLIPATISYNATTKTATLTPSAALAYSTAYSAIVKGGSLGVKDAANNALVSNYSWSFTTLTPPDVTPPTVISVLPANGTTGVVINTTVSVVFSEPMNALTINTSTIELRNPSSVLIPATVSYNAVTKTATLTPSAALAYSTVYSAVVKGGSLGVKDAAGNAMVSNYSWSFTTAAAPDVTPPTVISVSPPNGSTGVSINTTVSVLFSEPMNPSSVGIITVELHNSSVLVPATISYNVVTKTGTLTPSAALAYSTVYTITVRAGSSGVKDEAGNAMVNNYSSSFTTGPAPDITAPTIVSVLPANGSAGVPVTTTVSALFSEAMNAGTIGTSTFELRNSSNALVTATVTYNAATKTATLTPSSPLAYSTTYTATIKGGSSGVKDAAGNAMVNDYSWSFATGVAPDNTAPTIISVLPANAATGISVSTVVSAVFSEAMNASTISTSTFELRDPANTLITATVTYNGATKTATLTPSAILTPATLYTATIKGGGSGVKDAAGNAMANNYLWSFTTGASIFDPDLLPDNPAAIDQPVEVGLRFRSSVNGQITGLRFYKGVGNNGTHIGHLWTNTGTQLGEVTFVNETASGWQQVLFTSPVSITAGATYVASYYSVAGIYAYSNHFFTQSYTNGQLTALADGEDGPNGIYQYSSSSTFPTNTYLSSNYFVDVIFSGTTGPDVTPPSVLSVTPLNGATGVNVNSAVTAVFNEPMNASTINGSSFELRTVGGILVPATVAYNGATMTATLTPSSPLSYYAQYIATVKSGAAGVQDIAGNSLASNYTWSFRAGDPPFGSPTEGPGGPILVISTSSNPFSRYAVEILRAEGLNEFAAADISAVNATMLNNYDVIVLGEMSVTADQVLMLTNWVNAGGTLIAFKPNALLAPLMGILPASGTLTDKYLLVNTASGAGVGIVGQTIQFHGSANQHTLSGATSLATLYSSASAATVYPAVTTRTVGSNGGRAVAFTYDLARSIVYTRQGNPAWAGQKRDGQIDPIRSDDMFFPDWIDFNKIAIPQADEQQRLLANIILQGNMHRKPLPRFWYLPRDLKAAVIMTGDDHSNNGTEPRFNQFKTLGPNTAQDVADWKAVRGSSYVYPGTPISNGSAVNFESQGFEIALHPTTNCLNFTPASLLNDFNTQLGQFASSYPGVSSPSTNRTHCLVWSDWASQPKVELQKGIRLDVTYYYWPEVWMQNRPGMFTGSGMPMRFADVDGSMIDVYQAPTQMTDETNMNYTAFCNAVLDKAIGSEGYYGVFTANMHTDSATSPGANAIIASALARQIPVISAKQMLTWLDARNNSSFGNMTWINNQLTFTVTARSSATNLKAMLPMISESGPLTSITMNGNSVAFTSQVIKGMQYAFFAVTPGVNTYVATYGGVTMRTANQVVPDPTHDPVVATTEPSQESKAKPKEPMISSGKLYVNALPNPSSNYFNIVISSNDENPVTVRVLDMFGRIVEIHEKVTSTGILKLGNNWRGGTYFAEVIQGEQRKVIKIVKAN